MVVGKAAVGLCAVNDLAVDAHVPPAGEALGALAAAAVVVDHDAVADADVAGLGADLDDLAARLVAGDDVRADPEALGHVAV